MDTKSIEDMITGEERRFKYADFDQDQALNIVEFQVSEGIDEFQSIGWTFAVMNLLLHLILDCETKELTYFYFQAFLHPESDERMSEVVLSEIIEDMDVDLDGQVSIEEYIADIINEGDDNTIQESERDNFNNNLDVDHNGQLSRDEVSFYKH